MIHFYILNVNLSTSLSYKSITNYATRRAIEWVNISFLFDDIATILPAIQQNVINIVFAFSINLHIYLKQQLILLYDF